jgi:hypothetical protein
VCVSGLRAEDAKIQSDTLPAPIQWLPGPRCRKFVNCKLFVFLGAQDPTRVPHGVGWGRVGWGEVTEDLPPVLFLPVQVLHDAHVRVGEDPAP